MAIYLHPCLSQLSLDARFFVRRNALKLRNLLDHVQLQCARPLLRTPELGARGLRRPFTGIQLKPCMTQIYLHF